MTRTRQQTAVLAVATGFGGYLAVLAWAVVLQVFARTLNGGVTLLDRQLINAAALALGTVLVLRIYFVYTDHTPTFLDVDRPTLWELLIGVAAIPVLLGVGIAAGELGVSPAEHGLEQLVRSAGFEMAILLAVTSVVVVGPAEELLYRNLVQKTLAEDFGTVPAIGGASVVFMLVHTTAYWGGSPVEVVSALVLVFALSLILGTIYAYTETVVVPALAHGGYDAVIFLVLALDPLAV